MNRSIATLLGALAIAACANFASANVWQPAGGGAGGGAGKPASVQPAPKPADAKPAEPPKPAPSQEKPVTADAEFVYVKLATNKGDIFLELNQAKAPISVKNFLAYVDKKFYDGTIFHRVIPRFMLQGGGYTSDLKEKATDKPIKNEWQNGLKNIRGSVAMARTSNPDSATAQFFINVQDNPFLDNPRPPDTAAYCVFGKVVGGMDTVEKITAVKTAPKGIHEAVPVEPVVITSATRVAKEDAMKGGGDKK